MPKPALRDLRVQEAIISTVFFSIPELYSFCKCLSLPVNCTLRRKKIYNIKIVRAYAIKHNYALIFFKKNTKKKILNIF
jgi:hypothetical protein